MKKALIALVAVALASAAFAGDNTGKIIKSKVGVPDGKLAVMLHDAAGNMVVEFSCDKLDETKGDVKVFWLDPENMPDGAAPVAFTWGDEIRNGVVENNVIGLMQLQNFRPDGGAALIMKVYFVGHVANRLKLGTINAANVVPVAGMPGAWGSVVNTSGLKGEKEAGIDAPKYLDLTEYGATVAVNPADYTATLTWNYAPATAKGLIITDGQFDIGLMVIEK